MSVEEVTPRWERIKLAGGRVLMLQDLSMLDIRDGEKLLGRPMDEWLPQRENDPGYTHSSVEAFGVILWLLSRKAGVSKADQIAGKWAFTLEDLLADVTRPDVIQHAKTIVGFFGGDPVNTPIESSPGSSPTGAPTTST